MGRYNNFLANVTCSHCRKEVYIDFQSDIGILEWIDFKPSDLVFGIEPQMKRSPVGEYGEPDKDFWAYGLGYCPNCRNYVWCRIEIRSNRFDKLLVVPEPDDPDEWEFL